MRKLALALAPMFLLACTQELVAPAEQAVHAAPALAAASDWVTHEESFGFPIYLDCLDETVEFTVVALYRDHVVTSTDGGWLSYNSKVWLLEGSTLVGQSGTWDVVRTAATAEGVTNLQINDRTTWTNTTTGQVMYVWLGVHFVVGGDGEVKLDTNPDFTRYCTLQH
jgi:hypothetical protein